MLVAAYARVSTGRQEQEQTVENQIMAIKEMAQKDGHTIVKVYKDEGWSGTILERPALDAMRIDARNKMWEGILAYDPDRIARKYSFQELVMDEMEELGTKVLFVTTPPARDDTDKLLYGVKGLFAEYERSRITERFRLGKLRKARDGHFVTGNAPYGYRYILRQGDKSGYYEVSEPEASVAKMIFELIGEQGMTMLQLIRKLYELGIPPRKNKEGIWKTSTLTTMLRNETYCGTAYYNRTVAIVPTNPTKNEKYKKIKKSSRKYKDRSEWVPIPCPAIISKELFLKVQKQLKTNYQMSQRNKKNQYLLADMMFCTCGCTRAGEGPQKGKHLYYRCTDRVKRYPLARNCFIKAVNARIADKLVWNEFSNLLTSQDTLEKLLKKHISDHTSELNKPNQEQIDALYAEKKKLEAEEKRYLKAYGAELITYEAFENMVKDIKFKMSQIVEQLNRLSPQTDTVVQTMPSSEEIKQFCDLMKKKMRKTDFEVRRATLRKFIDKIVADQQWLNITGYIPIYLRKEAENVEFRTECRNSWSSKCREIYII